jgi:N6-adenosine-specific RNA methylase IME4
MKANIICADCPWPFSDKLTMSKTKRGAKSQYKTMSIKDIKALPVKDIAADDAVLVLWCPSSLLPEGLEVMKDWGFNFKQTHIWVKTKKPKIKALVKSIPNILDFHSFIEFINSFLNFGMGRLFRNTHEIALIGTRGKIYKYLEDKSQRSVHLFPSMKHSKKPELLQDMLDKMFPSSTLKVEMFARRSRSGWICIGNEAPDTIDEDIRVSLNKLINL